MIYASWAAFHEGSTDSAYLEVLLPRLMETIVAQDGEGHTEIPTFPSVKLGTSGRGIEEVASEICEARDAFEIVFIHADTGGRNLEANVGPRSSAYCDRANELCQWPPVRCVTIIPRHETEAWVLADPAAVLDALGYRGTADEVGLPGTARQAEQLRDPKAVLAAAMERVSGGRRRSAKVNQLLPAVAQRQSIDALRGSSSFRDFEARLRDALIDLRCIPARN